MRPAGPHTPQILEAEGLDSINETQGIMDAVLQLQILPLKRVTFTIGDFQAYDYEDPVLTITERWTLGEKRE